MVDSNKLPHLLCCDILFGYFLFLFQVQFRKGGQLEAHSLFGCLFLYLFSVLSWVLNRHYFLKMDFTFIHGAYSYQVLFNLLQLNDVMLLILFILLRILMEQWQSAINHKRMQCNVRIIVRSLLYQMLSIFFNNELMLINTVFACVSLSF